MMGLLVTCRAALVASEPNWRASEFAFGRALALCLALCVWLPNQAVAQQDGTPSPQAPFPSTDRSPSGIVLSGGLGLDAGLGYFYATPTDPSTSPLPSWFDRSVRQSVSGQLPFSFGVAYRPIPFLSFGLSSELAKVFPARCAPECAGAAFYLGGDVRFHFRTERLLSPWISLGLGYELLHFETQEGSASLDGYAIDLQAGADLRTGRNWTFGPCMGLRIGTYTHMNTYPSWRGATRQSVDIPFQDQAIHAWVMLGVRGTFTVSRK
jgi:hypothetical protein